jgi:hypothetical protein
MVSTSDRRLGAESDLRFVSSLPLEGPLNDDAFKVVATFELPSAGKRKTRKVLEPATGIEPATCGLRISEDPPFVCRYGTGFSVPWSGIDSTKSSFKLSRSGKGH